MSGSRLITLDVLRGFALFGIFYAHMLLWFAGGPLEQHYYQPNYDPGSNIALGLYMVLVIAKFFSIFAFLFGVSFYIQLESLAQRHVSPAHRFAWRLSILLLIGILHHLFWRADILSIYAVLGFLLIFFTSSERPQSAGAGDDLCLEPANQIGRADQLLAQRSGSVVSRGFASGWCSLYSGDQGRRLGRYLRSQLACALGQNRATDQHRSRPDYTWLFDAGYLRGQARLVSHG
jgi:hypothetical protein